MVVRWRRHASLSRLLSIHRSGSDQLPAPLLPASLAVKAETIESASGQRGAPSGALHPLGAIEVQAATKPVTRWNGRPYSCESWSLKSKPHERPSPPLISRKRVPNRSYENFFPNFS